MEIITKIGEDVFALKNLDVYERMSEETTAFCADIYIDGVCIGQCQNSGKGEGNYPYVGPQFRALYENVEEALSKYRYHEDNFYGKTIDWAYSMDFLIGMMVEAAYYEKKTVYKI